MKAEFIDEVIEKIIRPVMPAEWLKDTRFLINPTGRFVVGGPQGDCGLTGRKIIVDTYGGAAHHGKDPTKVDRSAAYACRYVAKNIVAAGLASQCQVQVAYAIGVAEPMNITVFTNGTGVIPDEQIAKLVRAHFDLRPRGIILSVFSHVNSGSRRPPPTATSVAKNRNSRGKRPTRPPPCAMPLVSTNQLTPQY